MTSIGSSAFRNFSGLTSITIPNSVTSIGDQAFAGCSGLTSITIPNGVRSIGDYTFQDCTHLHSVTIGTGVTSIGNVFYNCKPQKVIWLTNTPPTGYGNASGEVNYVANDQYTSLGNKTVYPFLSSMFEADGVKYVPVSPSERTCHAIDCVYDSTALNIKIGKTVSYRGIDMAVEEVKPYTCCYQPFVKSIEWSFEGNIPAYVFYGCQSLESISIPDAVTSLGEYAFANCSNMVSAKIGNGITTIKSAFSGCSSLTNVQIGNSVHTIGTYAFSGCSGLTSITIPNSVTFIGTYAFSGCSKLPSITIPQNVTGIGEYAFNGCSTLGKVIMEDSDTELSLGSHVFSCPLDSVYIGRNIAYQTTSYYGYSPFYRNTSLRSITITDKETEITPYEFYGCTNLKNVRIGNSVKTIGDWAFSGCSSLDFFSFGSNVESIGKEAFSDCTAMTKLISHAAVPPTCAAQALDDINKWNCTLTVPVGYTSAYQQADQWKEFFFIDEATGITRTMTDQGEGYRQLYDLNGHQQPALRHGLNIIKKNDGTTKKVVVK